MGCGSSINYEVFKGSKRGQMRLNASYDQDFLTHHLSNEASLSQYASTDAIKKRQIIEHMMIDQFNGRFQCDPNYSDFYVHNLSKSWAQRLFLDFLEQMDEDYFKNGKSYDVSREKLADRYLFELYQMKQFLHAGSHRIKDEGMRNIVIAMDFSYITFQSDAALFPLLKTLKEKYPQVADSNSKAFPDVKELKQDANLLTHFKAMYNSDPKFINIATTAIDLKYLFDTAFGQFQDFKTDMQDILGVDVLADVKVKCANTDRGRTYNASSTRRVLIKWVQTLLERIPDQIYTQAFVDFLIAKNAIIDNFHVKSTTETQTTHNTIIRVLLKLIEDLKIDAKSGSPHPKFGFFIYDLLRCKTHREDGNGVVQLIQKMKSVKTTKTGKKLEVLRIKNRLKTPNRDVMVNFRYGDIIVAEAQLGIDSSTVSEKDKKTNKFNHYLYELQRGLFGPTVELMMQYEDFNRKDVIVDLKIEDTVVPRTFDQKNVVEKTDRKCPVGHQMIQLHENYFFYLKNASKQINDSLQMDCDYCLKKAIPFSEGYDYCYKCSLFFCKRCREQYKQADPKKIVYSISQKLPEFKSKEELQKNIKTYGYYTVVFVDMYSSISILTVDYLAYLNSFFINRMGNNIKFGIVDVATKWGKDFAKDIDVSRFPTFVAFDRNLKPRKRLIGASVLHIDWFNDYAEKLANPNIVALEVPCTEHHGSKLQLVNVENLENWKCRYCGNAQSIDSFGGFMRAVSQDNTTAYQCPYAHDRVFVNEQGDQIPDTNFVCKNCAYLACEDDSITYFDVTGKSYLSTKFRKQISKSCKNGHPLDHVHKNPNQNYKLVCSDCEKIFMFSQEDGIMHCETCNYIMCPKCMGLDIIELDKDRVNRELVSHFAEMTASQVLPCKRCFNLYIKQYSSPHPLKFQADEGQDEDIVTLQKAFFSLADLQWKCCVCKKNFKCTSLHLACNLCKLEACLDCSRQLFENNTDIFDQPPTTSNLKCPSGHQTVKTKQQPDQSTTKFSCNGCKATLTINSENYWCKTCNTRYCSLCGPVILKPKNASCFNGHQLNSRPNYISDYLQCSLNPNHIMHQDEIVEGNERIVTIYHCESCKFYACDPNKCRQPIKQCAKNHNLRIKKELSFKRHCRNCDRFITPLSYCCELCDYDLCFRCYKMQPNSGYY